MEPVRQVDNHPGEETRFREAQQKPSDVKLFGTTDECGENGDQTPGDHNARDPPPCAPSFDGDRTWHLKQDVAQIKHADAKAIDAIAETEVCSHSKIGKRDIDAIDVVDDINQEDEWQQT